MSYGIGPGAFVKPLVIGTVLLVLAILGGNYAMYRIGYNRGVAECEAKANAALAKAQTDALAKQKTFEEQLKEALDAKDKALSDLGSTRSELDRVRDAARSYRARLPQASSPACKSYRRAVERSVELQEESAELLREATELLQRNAANHDALVKAIKTP